MEIWVMKIACVFGRYLEEKSAKICEIQARCNLEKLCYFILESFAFDQDHLHEFFMSRKGLRSRRTTINNERTTLANIFPIASKNQLFMQFDFGDDWVFKITRSRKQTTFNEKSYYPKVIEHIGNNPEQYPMCEDWN